MLTIIIDIDHVFVMMDIEQEKERKSASDKLSKEKRYNLLQNTHGSDNDAWQVTPSVP